MLAFGPKENKNIDFLSMHKEENRTRFPVAPIILWYVQAKQLYKQKFTSLMHVDNTTPPKK